MPSKSLHQHLFFKRCLEDPKFAKQHGITKAVAQEYVDADKKQNVLHLPEKIKPKKKN